MSAGSFPQPPESRWIGGPLAGGPRTSAPCPTFRRSFQSTSGEAVLTVTALGVYRATLNGVRVGDDELSPGWTDYRKRVHVRRYDVSSLLREGENEIAVEVGDGWAVGHVSWAGRSHWADRPMLLAWLEIGSRVALATDGKWEVGYGGLLQADLLMGEAVDLRRREPVWLPAQEFEPKVGPLIEARHPPIRVTQTVEPVSSVRRPGWPGAKTLFDFGQNLVGRVVVEAQAEPGETAIIRHAEVLDSKGEPYYANLRSAAQTDVATFDGPGVYEPRFTFHGFRYVEVAGIQGEVKCRARVLHSDVELSGSFKCSDERINRLFENARWSLRGNFLDVPTDCPQRDERLGWTGDMLAFLPAATRMGDVGAFVHKWLRDLADSQDEEGRIPAFAPSFPLLGPDGGPAWADAMAVCPVQMYRADGDLDGLREHYPAMRRYAAWLMRAFPGVRGGPNDAFAGFGDWLAEQDTPKDLIGTAMNFEAAESMLEAAKALGEEADEAEFRRWRDHAVEVFRANFVTPSGRLVAETQSACILALPILDPAHRGAIGQALVDDIGRRGWRLATGFIGTPRLLATLSGIGRHGVAGKLLLQTQKPSWLFPILNGATTIWERWDGWTPEAGFQDPGMNSFNHYAFGAVVDWLFGSLAGIQALEPGYRRHQVRPRPIEGIDWLEAVQPTPHGPIRSSWKR